MSGNAFHEQTCSLSILRNYLDNPEQIIYVEIPFGILRYKNKEMYEQLLSKLDQADAEYIDSMFFERRVIYYKLNIKMENILSRITELGLYQGKCFLQELK